MRESEKRFEVPPDLFEGWGQVLHDTTADPARVTPKLRRRGEKGHTRPNLFMHLQGTNLTQRGARACR